MAANSGFDAGTGRAPCTKHLCASCQKW
jgi:hypothetical protein